MARIGEVQGDPNLVLVSTMEGEPLVTLWWGWSAPTCRRLLPAG